MDYTANSIDEKNKVSFVAQKVHSRIQDSRHWKKRVDLILVDTGIDLTHGTARKTRHAADWFKNSD
jgi:hypothetical protein